MKHIPVILNAILPLLGAAVCPVLAFAGGPDSLQIRYGVTEFSVNFMREAPDFPEELGNQLLMGTPVEITAEEGYWKKAVSPEPYEAWCVEMGLVEMDSLELAKYIAAPKYIVTAEYSHVFSGPSERSERLSDLVMGDLLRIALRSRQTTSGTDSPHVRAKRLTANGFARVILPSGAEGYVRKADIAVFRDWAESRKADGENIVRTAELFLGVPYQWGGTSIKGVDCSGLTRMVWFMNGVLLPRNASQQARTGIMIPYPGKGDGTVERETMLEFCSRLEPGDLLFFGSGGKVSHVGIYTGNGKFIHASQKVRTGSLIPGDNDYYDLSWKLLHARRVIGHEDTGTGVKSILKSPAYFPQDS